jgi:Protein of unknown function (DUF3574)
MRRLLPFLALSAALVATGAMASPIACSAGLHRATTAELFFGRNIEDNGQWRNPTGGFVREQSKALFLVLSGAPDERQKLELVRNAYKARFHQESVMMVEQQACIGF